MHPLKRSIKFYVLIIYTQEIKPNHIMTSNNYNQKRKGVNLRLMSKQFYICMLFVFTIVRSNAQISTFVTMSTVPIAGSPFTIFASAISALNGLTIIGPVEEDVTAWQTETLIDTIVITETGTVTIPLTIQKSGEGANLILTPHAGTYAIASGVAIIDGMFILT